MLFEIQRCGNEFPDRAKRGRLFLDKIAGYAGPDTLWRSFLKSESERLGKRDDSVLFHDELNEQSYSPLYFHDFMKQAHAKNLQFLSEARLRDMLAPALSPEAASGLAELAQEDTTSHQQYLDFALFQAFRRTLLCRQTVTIDRHGPTSRITNLFVASPLKARRDHTTDGSTTFDNSRGAGRIQTNDLAIVSALRHLESSWPEAEPFEVVLQVVCRDLPKIPQHEVKTALRKGFLELAVNDLIDLRTYTGSASSKAGLNPKASPLCRLQATNDSTVTTLLHTNVDIADPTARLCLTMLDGTRGANDLARELFGGTKPEVKKKEEMLTQLLAGFKALGLFFSDSTL